MLGGGGHQCIVDGTSGDSRFDGKLDQGCLLATWQRQRRLGEVSRKQGFNKPSGESVGRGKSGQNGIGLERNMGWQSRLARQGRTGGHVGLVP